MLEPTVILRARDGDDAAIEQVARHTLTTALRVAALITGSRELAEDIAQNTAILRLRSLVHARSFAT